jgi:aldehyde dehydrogenase (NAD+)
MDANPVDTALSAHMLIGGRRVMGGGDAFDVENPANGQVFATIQGASEDDFLAAITAARAAADKGDWAALKPAERVAVVRRFIAALNARMPQIERAVLAETGCPVGSGAFHVQTRGGLQQAEQQLELYLTLPEILDVPQPLEMRINMMGAVSQSVRRFVPMGVVAGISAYNFPFYLNIWKVIPALATGNAVILRPSPLTPLSALAMVDAAIEAGIPDGVFNVVAEGGAAGALLLTTDPRVNMVSFTGSTDVGRKVMAQGAATMKRLQLELGGKSAQIYLPDRVDVAATAARNVCLAHAGQGCVLGTRVFVPEDQKAETLAAMAQSLSVIVPGDPADPKTMFGPLISAGQVERCERYVSLAVEAGAKVISGGRRVDRPGHYFEPTLLEAPDNKNPAAQDEIFGPIVVVIGYRDVEHAIEMANDTIFGLSGYVYGKDVRAALEVAKRIRSGTVNVNIGGMASGYGSSGGHGQSGLGRERGEEGLRAYQEVQVLNIAN